jgi:hypothetical protein
LFILQVHSFDRVRKLREEGRMQRPNALSRGKTNVVRMQELTAARAGIRPFLWGFG